MDYRILNAAEFSGQIIIPQPELFGHFVHIPLPFTTIFRFGPNSRCLVIKKRPEIMTQYAHLEDHPS